MKKKYQLIFLFSVVIAFAQPPKKVLFVGNSLTYFNNMPALFESIANEKGKNIDVDYYAPGGTGFLNHYIDSNVYNLFKNNTWDVVVLQPGTSESAGVSFPINTTAERGNQLKDSILEYSPCAKVFLYEISNGVASSSTYSNYYYWQTKIKDSITKLADSMRVPMVAAGECIRHHYNINQDIMFHNSYGDVHPNLNGSYLIACAMYCTIYQEPVSGILFNGGVTQLNATYYQGIADNVVLNNKPAWRINTYNLHAEFNVSIAGSFVQFINDSTNFSSIIWDFGDGNISTDFEPLHQYSSTGTKIVTVTVTKNGCSETFTKEIQISTLSLNEFQGEYNVVSHDNSSNFLTIMGNKNLIYDVFSIDGKKIVTFEKKSDIVKISTEELASGIYILKSKCTSEKFIVK